MIHFLISSIFFFFFCSFFVYSSSSRAPRFKGYQQQDSQELLHYLMDSIRVEEIKVSLSGLFYRSGRLGLAYTYLCSLKTFLHINVVYKMCTLQGNSPRLLPLYWRGISLREQNLHCPGGTWGSDARLLFVLSPFCFVFLIIWKMLTRSYHNEPFGFKVNAKSDDFPQINTLFYSVH